jgi:Methyltransferase domain
VRAGYTVIGIDESLQRIMAARRVAEDLGIKAEFLVADARCLPFKPETFDVVFSYSVLQHLSEDDTATSVQSIRSVLKTGAKSYVQMANIAGLRSFTNYLRLPSPTGFNVRYWRISEMRRVFSLIGETDIQPDGFFGLNIQASDLDFLPLYARTIIKTSEVLRRLPLTTVADSVYVNSVKR